MRAIALVIAVFCLADLTAVAQEAAIPQGSRPEPGKQIHFNIFIVDLPADNQVAGLGAGELAKRVVALEQQGQLRGATRIPLTTLDQTPATIQFGKSVAVETGRIQQGGRGSMASYSIQNGGTMVQLTPALQENGAILVECTIEQTRIPEKDEENSQATPNVKAETITVKSTVRLQPGQPVLVGGRKTVQGNESAQTWIVLTASVEKESN